MAEPLKDLRNIPSKIREWEEGHGLLKLARKLCREYIKENSGEVGLNDFDAEQVKVRFDRQVLVFREGHSSLKPQVETILSMDVYNGMTSIGTFKLVSKLNGQTLKTWIDLDGQIMANKKRKP